MCSTRLSSHLGITISRVTEASSYRNSAVLKFVLRILVAGHVCCTLKCLRSSSHVLACMVLVAAAELQVKVVNVSGQSRTHWVGHSRFQDQKTSNLVGVDDDAWLLSHEHVVVE